MEWEGYKNYDHYYNFNQRADFWDEVNIGKLTRIQKNKFTEYYNIPCSFDIETSSWYEGDTKRACMYLWAFGLNGSVIVGRTWREFDELMKETMTFLDLSPDKKVLVCYVHNLGYEFQWFRKRIPWVEDGVFSVKNRRPVYALSKLGIEFRCSLLLSNYRLAYVGAELLKKYPVRKLVGALDYSLVRSPITPITDSEMAYQCNDVRVVMSYIQEKIEIEGDICAIPLTNTGYVRRYCRDYCLGQLSGDESTRRKKLFEYRVLMKDLTIKSEKEYKQLRDAFAGGFTHANPNHWGEILHNVGSADLTSSYPYTMVSDYFPMSGGSYIGEVTSDTLFEMLLSRYCCLFTVVFHDLSAVITYDSYISLSKCTYVSSDRVVNNGRVVTADELQITITELDWDIISKVYEWESVEIFDMRIYDRDYLPRPMIMSILELYKNKTSLKGVEGKEVEYMVSKNMINAAYGMAVTNIVRDEVQYENNDWLIEEADAASQLTGYNKQFNRFLFYAWGVWVTAHARHNLWEAIFEFEDDYVYADTDSIKGINFDKHERFFKKYNLDVYFKLSAMCEHYNIPFEYCQPLTKKGVKKLIGVWDREEDYLLFKTLGAKRYMYEHADHSFNMTVAGVSKNDAVPYLLSSFGGNKYRSEEWLKKFKLAYSKDPEDKETSQLALEEIIELRKAGKISYETVLKMFKENLVIPPAHTGKSTLTYIDDAATFVVKDYKGYECEVHEESAIHMEPVSYFFSLSKEYLDFLDGIQDASF